MNITQNLIIAKEISKYEPGKPYCLWIVDNGRCGDKFNVDTNSEYSTFPVEASDRFETLQEAIVAHGRFLQYVESKIAITKKKPPKPGGPSWHRWK